MLIRVVKFALLNGDIEICQAVRISEIDPPPGVELFQPLPKCISMDKQSACYVMFIARKVQVGFQCSQILIAMQLVMPGDLLDRNVITAA